MKRLANLLLGTLLIFTLSPVIADKGQIKKETHKIAKAEKAPSASKNEVLPLKDSFLHPKAMIETWTLSGIVQDEESHRFGYTFFVLRELNTFKVMAEVISLATGKAVFHYNAEKEIPTQDMLGINLKIQDAFLRYNEINDSWVFGVSQKEGFNFRVEANQKYEYEVEHVPGISFYSLQGMRVNGQLGIDGKNTFVMAKNAWLSHEWRDEKSRKYSIKRVYCRLIEDRGFLLEQISKGKNRLFDGATLLDPSGKKDSVSQFVQLSQESDKQWKINIVSPKLKLRVDSILPTALNNTYGKMHLYSGIIQKAPEVNGGFCLLTEQ